MVSGKGCLIGKTINVQWPSNYLEGYGRLVGIMRPRRPKENNAGEATTSRHHASSSHTGCGRIIGIMRPRRYKENNGGEATTSQHQASSSHTHSRDFNEMIVQCKILAWTAKAQLQFVVSSYDASLDMHLVTFENGATGTLKLSPRETQPAKKLEGSTKQEQPPSKSDVYQSCDHLRRECKRKRRIPAPSHSRMSRALMREVKEERSSKQTTSVQRPALPAVDKVPKKNKKTLVATPSTVLSGAEIRTKGETLPVIDVEETSPPVLNEGNTSSEQLFPSLEVLNMRKKLLQELCGEEVKQRIDAMSHLARSEMLTALLEQLGCFLGPVLKEYETMRSHLSFQNGEIEDLSKMLSDKERELVKADLILQDADRSLCKASEEIEHWKNKFDALQLRSSQELDSVKQELSQVKNELSQVKEQFIA